MRSLAPPALAVALTRGAPSRRVVRRAVAAGALAQLAGIALLGGATGLLTWSAARPGLATVAGLLVAVELVAFSRAPLRHAERVSAHDLGLDGLSGWRTWLLDSVATWPPSRLASARSGDLLSRCVEDTDRLQDLWVRVLVPAASAVVALLCSAVLLAILDPLAGASVAAATALVTWATWNRSSYVARLGVEEASIRGAIAARSVEYAKGAAALVLLGADASHRAATEALASRADRLATRRDATVSKLYVVAALTSALALLAAVLGAPLPTSRPGIVAGVVLATYGCAELLAVLAGSVDALGHVAGAANRLVDLPSPRRGGDLAATPGVLSLSGLDVAGGEEGPVLLRDVNVDVEPRQLVCVVGPTGSGKSALLGAAAALELPRAGTVALDGHDVASLDEASLRREVGWLPTHPTLLEGRVRDVLDVGRGIDDETLRRALDAVGLTASLHDRGGLDAVVGLDEHDLSGGERRRLALARLLAGSPSVYVLDEPTAGLDDRTVDVVLASLSATGAAVMCATHDARVTARAARTVRSGDAAMT